MASRLRAAGLWLAVLVELSASVLMRTTEGEQASNSQGAFDDHPVPPQRTLEGEPPSAFDDWAFDEYHLPPQIPKSAQIEWTGQRWTPRGWVYPREPGKRAYFDIHIPKTAGCSFSKDLRWVLAPGEGYHSKESCFYTSKPMEAGDGIIAFLRNPVMHVYSQFLECKYDKWGKQIVPEEDLPILENVTTWLRHFEGGAVKYNLRCYHPYNMQARALTCQGPGGAHHYRTHGPPRPEVALKNLGSLFFVGVVEHYAASVCLFFAKTQPGQPLPKFCDCTDESSSAHFKHFSHFAPPHSLGNLTEEDRSMIAELTQVDQQLYDRALERFGKEVGEVERTSGTKILC